jgi:hypothetical protein
VYKGWCTVGGIHSSRIQGICCNLVIYGHEEAIEYQKLLEREGSIFHCSSVSNVMTWKRFMALNKCLHITNPIEYVKEKGLPGYDKLEQVRWLVNAIRDSCTRVWKLGKFCTIDEMMITADTKEHIVPYDSTCFRSVKSGA